jgi:methionyl-tRNA formyltransferase
MRLGVLTSVDTRHRYFANAIGENFDVVAIGYERTGYAHAEIDASDLTPEEAGIVADHFAERLRQEEIFFGAKADWATEDGSCAVRHLQPGTLNRDETLALLDGAGVDTVAVFGTNLIKPPLLGHWPGRMINMHLGLSPYYRGTATNFYPLLNGEPEYVGATIHLLDNGIDSGPILRHARPEIVAEDRPHTIGCKAILAGIEAFLAVLADLEQGTLEPVAQWEVPNPRLYLRKDYHPRQVVELYRKIDAGLIRRYAEQARQRAERIRLVM